MNLRQFVMSAPRRSASIPALSNQVRNTRNLWPITAPHRSRKLSSVSESSSVSTKSRWKEALYKISIYKCNLLSEFACFLLKLVLIVFLLLLLRHLLLVLLFFYFCFLWLCVFLLSFFLLFLLSLLPPNPPPPHPPPSPPPPHHHHRRRRHHHHHRHRHHHHHNRRYYHHHVFHLSITISVCCCDTFF